ncbi:hypothetical protein I6F37_41245, partial [Bradyrhizobium sp. NBAIM08]|nr:hypothetical protein [Bradyrhizobium sp. NBAIM08]
MLLTSVGRRIALLRAFRREVRAFAPGGRVLGTDVQAQAIFAGRRPVDDPEAWGRDDEERWGVLSIAAGEERVPSAQGRYHDYYTAFGAAVRGEGPLPVTGADGVRTLEV